MRNKPSSGSLFLSVFDSQIAKTGKSRSSKFFEHEFSQVLKGFPAVGVKPDKQARPNSELVFAFDYNALNEMKIRRFDLKNLRYRLLGNVHSQDFLTPKSSVTSTVVSKTTSGNEV